MSNLIDQITHLEQVARERLDESNKLTARLSASQAATKHLLSQRDRRVAFLTDWCALHGVRKDETNAFVPTEAIEPGCVVELLTALRAIERGDDVAELNGTATTTDGSNVDHEVQVEQTVMQGENHIHADPVAVLFSALAQVLQENNKLNKGARIKFEFVKD